MKKLGDDKIKNTISNENNVKTVDDFLLPVTHCMQIYATQKGDAIEFSPDPPAPKKLVKKGLLIIRVRPSAKDNEVTLTLDNIDNEVIFMEINKDTLGNLHAICNEVYMPVMGNPYNMVDWSDLVTKDLMDKFHQFMAHTYVTIGQIKGRTLLPLPPSDSGTAEKTSSKDKANLLENAIMHWSK